MAQQQSSQKQPTSSQAAVAAPIPFLQPRAFAEISEATKDASQPDLQAKIDQASTFGHSLGRINTRPLSHLPIQPKLTIGKVGDPYEQEADRVAAQVVQQINQPAATSGKASVQRQASEEDKLQRKPDIQRRSDVGGTAASANLESSINQARGGGQGLSDSIRQPMEQAFGADFSSVRVHTDSQSDQLSRSINAQAFTTKNDIFFSSGTYNPGDRGGQALLAHELTHVVQQGGAGVQRQTAKNSAQVEGTSPVQISRMPSETIQRQLMPYDFWMSQTHSTVKSRGDQLKALDQALATYIDSKKYLERDPNNKGHKKQHAEQFMGGLSSAIKWYLESDEDTTVGSFRRDAAKILQAQFAQEPDARPVGDGREYEFDLSKKGPDLNVMLHTQFLELTSEGTFTGKSSFQNSIAKKLIQFHSMVSDDQLELVIPLLYEMKTDVEYWQVRYKQKTTAKQAKRKNRAVGMQTFLDHLNQQIAKAEGVLGKEIAAGMTRTEGTTDEEYQQEINQAVGQRVQKMRQKYVGSADSMFATIGGFLVDKLAGEAGAKAELDTEIKIPVDPSGVGFIGGHFNLKAEAEKSSTKIRGELGITGGAKVPRIIEVKAELGGYMEATAQNAEKAMKLISYAFYRRIRESRSIPRELGSYIWGGSSDGVGYKKSEAWAGNVEKEIFGGQGGDDASVESGAYAALSADIGDPKALHGGVKVKGNKGKKYTKKSVTAAKGELGKLQEEASTRFSKQTVLGASTEGVELSGALSGGPFNGDFSAGLQWVGEGQDKECAWTVEANATLDIPTGTGIGKIAGSAMNVAIDKVTDYLRTKYQLNKGEKWIGAADLASLLGPASATREHINNSRMTPQELEKAKKAAEDAKVQSAGGVGCTFVIEGKGGTVEKVQLNLDKASRTEVDLEVFKVGLKQRKRYVGLKWQGGWSVV